MLIAAIAGSFHFVMVPRKMPATLSASRFRPVDAGHVVDHHHGPERGRDVEHLGAGRQGRDLLVLHRRVGCAEVDGPLGDGLDAAARADRLVVDLDVRVLASLYDWNQTSYSGSGKVAPAPWRVIAAVAGRGAAAAEGATDSGALDAGAVADAAADRLPWMARLLAPLLEQALRTSTAPRASAPRRLELVIVTSLIPPVVAARRRRAVAGARVEGGRLPSTALTVVRRHQRAFAGSLAFG